jgi:transposase
LAAFAPRLRTPWQSAYHYFRVWRIDGTWERIHTPHCGSEPAGRLLERSRAQGSHRRQPVGEDHRKRGVRGYDGAKRR